MGVLATIATRHAYAHFRPEEHAAEHPHASAQKNVPLPPAVREHMLESAQNDFQKVLDRSSAQFQHDLNATEERLTKQLERLGSDIVGKEIERYHSELDHLREQAETLGTDAQAELTQHQAELKAKLDERMAAEQERLLQLMDTKLADAVASFLTETMQHNIDLGAQAPYLSRMLIEHTAELKRELTNEA